MGAHGGAAFVPRDTKGIDVTRHVPSIIRCIISYSSRNHWLTRLRRVTRPWKGLLDEPAPHEKEYIIQLEIRFFVFVCFRRLLVFPRFFPTIGFPKITKYQNPEVDDSSQKAPRSSPLNRKQMPGTGPALHRCIGKPRCAGLGSVPRNPF